MLGVNGGLGERRAHQRVPVRTQIDVVIDAWAQLPVCDISLGGVRLVMPFSPPIGTRLVVEMTLPNKLQLSLEAEVRNVGAPDEAGRRPVGLRWLETEESALLSELIAAVS
jgi:hypothetical protein